MPQSADSRKSQLRLLLEELLCDLCLFDHTANGCPPESVRVDREFPLGPAGAFADIRVCAPNSEPYFVEIKHGYPPEQLVAHLNRKYAHPEAILDDTRRLILVLDNAQAARWAEVVTRLAPETTRRLAIEIWDERHLTRQLQSRFGVHIESIAEGDLLDVREAIERAKGCYAFGGVSLERYHNDPLAAELLWHFDFWRLRQLRQGGIACPRDILPPRLYRNVAIVFGDLCSFSSFVRDTPEDNLTRHCLTSFYSKARHQIVKHGGMLYQFVGDAVVGLFGVPDQSPGYIEQAVSASRSLLSIGASVCHHWQRHIDHAQATTGLRIGIALGDLQIVSFRPFSRTHVGAIGDAINIAARLQSAAEPNRIVISNILYTHLSAATQAGFTERSPVQAKNLGAIKAWQTHPPHSSAIANFGSPPGPT